MKYLRVALGVLVGAYALYSLFPIGTNAAYKLGLLGVSEGEARLIPLWEATPWWQLAVWAALTAFLLHVAWRLVRGRTALTAYVVALLLYAALWWTMQAQPAYQQAFTPAELQLDYLMLLAMALVGGLIWWVEGRPDATAAHG
jgi:hypothetical protein